MKVNYDEGACKYLILRVYKQAASDYVLALKRLKNIYKVPEWMGNERLRDRFNATTAEIERLENFFNNDPYCFLGDGVGQKIINELRKRAKVIGSSKKIDPALFSKRLRELLEKNALQYEDVSSATGIPPDQIRHYVEGCRVPTTERVKLLSYYFGVSEDYIKCFTNERN